MDFTILIPLGAFSILAALYFQRIGLDPEVTRPRGQDFSANSPLAKSIYRFLGKEKQHLPLVEVMVAQLKDSLRRGRSKLNNDKWRNDVSELIMDLDSAKNKIALNAGELEELGRRYSWLLGSSEKEG